MAKTVRLGNRLRYPITIVKLHKSPGDVVQKEEPLFQYSFKWMKEVGDSIRGEMWEQEQTTSVHWNSPSDGKLIQWQIKEGQEITQDRPCYVIEEECSHEIQFQGLCGMCGKDMTETSWAQESRDTERATIRMVHDQNNLTVSATHAQKAERELQKRLLDSRRLSLVVDLDQTIIQACIDPTVGQWMQDPTNPNYDAVKTVKTFQLNDDPPKDRIWYYIKMRPGLEDFLKRISTMYEMHVYTMGTRNYAQGVASAVDPEKRYFGNRIISRDENGNLYAKSLQRLFPVSTNMVVIIDDRSDVWPRNRPNLIKVTPFDFFKGIGDINSSFLPKRQDILKSAKTNGVKKAPVKVKGEEEVTKEQIEEQKQILEQQVKERPLQALQDKVDKEDEEADKVTVQSEDGFESRSSSPPPQRHKVLFDDDHELRFLEEHLTKLHKTFFEEYDATVKQEPDAEIPDVGALLDNLKSEVLAGYKIVLSGVLPSGYDIYRSEIGLQIMSFGAELLPAVTRDVTHLVVNTAQPGTEKLAAARRYKDIKIVGLEWLAECFTQWQAVDETDFLYHGRHHAETAKRKLPGEDGAGDEEEEEGEDKGAPNGKPKGLKLNFVNTTAEDMEEGLNDEDQGLLPDDPEDGEMSPIDGLKTFNWGSADEELNEFLASGSSDDGEDEDEDEDENMDDEDQKDVEARDPQVMLKVPGDPDDTDTEYRLPPGTKPTKPSPKKRKHAEQDAEEGATGTDSEQYNTTGDEAGGNNKAKKRLKRIKSQRTSSLRNQYEQLGGDSSSVAAGDKSSLPTPVVTGDEQDEQDQRGATAKVAHVAQQQPEVADDEFEFDEAELEAEFEAEFAAAEQEEAAAVAAASAAILSSAAGASGDGVGEDKG
ncbi:hypothetical protein QBC38DRAFT_253467 [Podospora fimiseda]|uniref:RNA polymerase II subunit A C-terminal domain phosphatase n=1 Tax=Podospora fimiseda TaxID=252190 RepID=A0AAN7BLC5_9PEZI|nr:hypothetical protein QBC38DRAFT_253467 [Podospora fimiseda]